MDTNELNELDIKLNLYDEICRKGVFLWILMS